MSIRVSVVVPTYKRPQLLRNCLNALVGQDFPPEDYEIIIVDYAVSEETRALVEKFSGEWKAKITEPASDSGSEAGSPPEIRYAAAADTQGPAAARYFLFTNATTQFQHYRYNAGAGSLLANIDAGALTPGSTSIKMSIAGTGASVTLKMYKDGVQVGSDIVDSDANRIVTAGYAGMHGFGATNGVASWSAGFL